MSGDDWLRQRKAKEVPACFGILENVFPQGEDGLRKSPESCMVCHCKTDCLRTAMAETGDGLRVREECVDRAYEAGMIGFLGRWSKKKSLARQRREKG